MPRIPADQVRFHPHSFADPAGRLFWWNGELYRGLRADSAALFRRLFREGTLKRLSEEGLLIDTWATDLRIDGYEMVVRHRVVPFASYPEEWCPAMLKDAALTLLDLLIDLAHCGLTLKDSHPWNLLFDRGRALYVDLTSITTIQNDQWRGYNEFRRFYLNPLILMAHNQERIARRLLPEYEGVTEADVSALTCGSQFARSLAAIIRRFKNARCKDLSPGCHPQAHARLYGEPTDAEKTAATNSLVRLFYESKGDIEAINLLTGADIAGKAEDFGQSVSSPDSWTPTKRCVQDMFAHLNPASVLDIGGASEGWYSWTVASRGSTAVTSSTDSALLTRLYAIAHRKRLPLLPVVMDFTGPTPSRGLCNHWSVAASERLKCDMVLALANIHQFVVQRSLRFDQIVEGLASFSKRWLIAEFVPTEDNDVGSCRSHRVSEYTLDNFIFALRARFRDVTIVAGHRGPGILVLCEK